MKSSSIFLKTGSFLQQLFLLFLEILNEEHKVLPLDKERFQLYFFCEFFTFLKLKETHNKEEPPGALVEKYLFPSADCYFSIVC